MVGAVIALLLTQGEWAQGSLVAGAGGQVPSADAWWAKRLAPELYASGLLNEEDIIEAKRAGFRTILSVWNLKSSLGGDDPNVSTRDAFGTQGTYRLAAAEQRFVESLGLTYMYLQPWCVPDGSACRTAELDRISSFLVTAPKPILIHCQISREATLATVWHLYRVGAYDPTQFYTRSMVTPGFVFAHYGSVPARWANLTGYAVQEGDAPEGSLNPMLKDYRGTWKVQRVSDTLYIGGGLQPGFIPTLATQAGFSAVVSLLERSPAAEASERGMVEGAGMRYASVPVPWPLPSGWGRGEWEDLA
eukprot:Hpha_TRINITY_DN21502_c0_g1::TRINITY_DN21502_c0_g1_i1::g.23::m.23